MPARPRPAGGRTADWLTSESADLLDAAPDAMLIASALGSIVFANAQAERLFGFTRSELLGMSVESLIPERLRNQHAKHRDGFSTAPRVRPMGVGMELLAVRKDGSEFPVEISLSPIRRAGELYVISAIRDITDAKRARQDIERLNADLGTKVLELSNANSELEAFTYSVSHDLRAPLRHIDSFSKILLDEAGRKLDKDALHYLARIRDGSQHMGRLVDDLLKLTRIGRQELKMQITGLNSLVEEAIGVVRQDARDREIEFRIGRLPFVECDPALMQLVFQNLLSNAVKYTRPREHALIEVDRHGESHAVYVRDNGVGFSMKYADKLFGVFQRLHRHEDFEGTGVGLATVQRIIHKHGGRVWAESELDKGATFYFTLDTSAVAAADRI